MTTFTAELRRPIGPYQRLFDARVTLDLDEDGPRHASVELGPDTLLHRFQVPEVAQRQLPMFARGRLDHFDLSAATEAALRKLRPRVVAEGAGDGLVSDIGPFLSCSLTDADGPATKSSRPNPAPRRTPPGAPTGQPSKWPSHRRPTHQNQNQPPKD